MKRIVCNKCNHGFEVIDATMLDISCPACGAVFSDEGTETSIREFKQEDFEALHELSGDEVTTRDDAPHFDLGLKEDPPRTTDEDPSNTPVAAVAEIIFARLMLDADFFARVVSLLRDDEDFQREVKGSDGTNGANGRNGKDGTNGTNGKDADPATVASLLAADPAFQAKVKGKDGTNGINGKDADPGFVANSLAADPAFQAKVKGKDGTNGTNGKDGKDATPADIERAVTAYINLNVDRFKGRKGDPGDSAPVDRVEAAVQAEVRRLLAAEPNRFRSQQPGDPGRDADPEAVANLLFRNEAFQRKVKGDAGDRGADATMWPAWVGIVLAIFAIVAVFWRTNSPSSPPPPAAPAAQGRSAAPTSASAADDKPAPAQPKAKAKNPKPGPAAAPKPEEPEKPTPAEPAPAPSPAATDGLPACDTCMATCRADSAPMVPSVFTKEQVDAMCAMDTPTSVCRKSGADATCQ